MKCRACRKAYRAAHYQANREHTLAVNKAWADRNPENVRRRSAEWHNANRDRHAALNAAWYQRNRDAHLARGRAWYDANRADRLERIRRWRELNPERVAAAFARWVRRWPDKIKAKDRDWRQRNPGKVREYAMARHAAKLRATPPWQTEEDRRQIALFYEAAALLQLATGEAYHVDHIVPLRGKNVCGLHVPGNLQILPALENIRKGNRFG